MHIHNLCTADAFGVRRKGGVETGGARRSHHYIIKPPTGVSERVFCYCLMMIFMLELRGRGKCERATFVLIKQVAADSSPRISSSPRDAEKPSLR
jgi:predicted nucleic acid-binding Zn finger protein